MHCSKGIKCFDLEDIYYPIFSPPDLNKTLFFLHWKDFQKERSNKSDTIVIIVNHVKRDLVWEDDLSLSRRRQLEHLYFNIFFFIFSHEFPLLVTLDKSLLFFFFWYFFFFFFSYNSFLLANPVKFLSLMKIIE